MVSANVFQEKLCIFLYSAEKSMFLACLQEKGEPPCPLGQNFCRMAGAVVLFQTASMEALVLLQLNADNAMVGPQRHE